MDSFFGQAPLASFNFQFFAYLITGLAVAWLLVRPRRLTDGFATLALVAISGAWLGAEGAHLFGQASPGGAHQLLAALIGAGVLAEAWRRLHPETLQIEDAARR